MSQPEFLSNFGDLYEHSPWIAAAVYAAGLDRRHDEPQALHSAFCEVIENASRAQQLALLRAHPDLAGKLAQGGGLTQESAAEQAGAGLDQCTAGEFAEFTRLNDQYQQRFGFPFIMAVKGASRAQILEQFRHRVNNDPGREFATALQQVMKIGEFRLMDIFND